MISDHFRKWLQESRKAEAAEEDTATATKVGAGTATAMVT